MDHINGHEYIIFVYFLLRNTNQLYIHRYRLKKKTRKHQRPNQYYLSIYYIYIHIKDNIDDIEFCKKIKPLNDFEECNSKSS
jgi:hypothetical protein